MPGDELDCGTVGLGDSAVGAAHLFRIFLREQRWISARNREPCSSAAEGLRHPFKEPSRRRIEARVVGVTIAQKSRRLVSVKSGDEGRSGFVGLLRNQASQRQGIKPSRHNQFLSACEPETDIHGDLGKTVEFLLKGKRCFGKL